MKLFKFLRKPYLQLTSPRHREMYAAYRQWRKDNAEIKRYDFPFLHADSVVIDLGGFHGEWADGIFVRYEPTIHVFEPHPKFARELEEKYAKNSKIHVHTCALSTRDGQFQLSDLGDGSSSRRAAGQMYNCRTVEAGAYLQRIDVTAIDLIKINIEGGEYEILPHLGQIGFLSPIRTLQIQFHLFSEGSVREREAIRETLRRTHDETWCYPFIWEQWDRKLPE